MSDAACENLAPHVLATLAKQIRTLAMNPPEGITYVPSDSLTEVLAEIAGPVGTPYEGGTFTVKMALTNDFPSAPPKGWFLTKIFHPNISNSGDICVNTLKKDWKPEHTLAHVLQVIRCLLIVPFPESSLNDDAGKLFMESYDEYARKAKLMTTIHAMGGSAVTADEEGSGAAASGSGSGAVESGSALTTAAAGKSNVAAPVGGAGEKKKVVAGGAGKEEKKKTLKRL